MMKLPPIDAFLDAGQLCMIWLDSLSTLDKFLAEELVGSSEEEPQSIFDKEWRRIEEGLMYCDQLIIEIERTSTPIEYRLMSKPICAPEFECERYESDTWVGLTAHGVAFGLLRQLRFNVLRNLKLIDDWEAFSAGVLYGATRIGIEFRRLEMHMLREHILVAAVHGKQSNQEKMQSGQTRRRNSKSHTESLVLAAIMRKLENPEFTELRCSELANIPVSTLNGHPLWIEWRAKIEGANANEKMQKVKREFDRKVGEYLPIDPESLSDSDTGRRFIT